MPLIWSMMMMPDDTMFFFIIHKFLFIYKKKKKKRNKKVYILCGNLFRARLLKLNVLESLTLKSVHKIVKK
jgi:hypothetical protein